MIRANIKNRAFDRMGEQWAPLIDPNHFLGRTAFDIPYPKTNKGPDATLVQKGELFFLEISAPGFRKEDLQVEIKDELLFVTGKRTFETETADSSFVQNTFEEDSFERVFKLAPAISREGISAKMENEVLHIAFRDVPAAEERSQRTVVVE